MSSINDKLEKLHEKFTGKDRWLWKPFFFLVASSALDSLKEVAAAIEPWRKHLETSLVGFTSIEVTEEMRETIIISASSRNQPRPDIALSPNSFPIDELQFKLTRAGKMVFRRTQDLGQFQKFCGILAQDAIF